MDQEPGQDGDALAELPPILARTFVPPAAADWERRVNASLGFLTFFSGLPSFRECVEYRAVVSEGCVYDVGDVADELKWKRLSARIRERDRERGRSRVVRLTAEWMGQPAGTLVRLLASDARTLRRMGIAATANVTGSTSAARNSRGFAQVRTAAACMSIAG